MTETLEPLFNNVLLREIDAPERRTPGGIVVPGKDKEASAVRCEVVAIGPGEIRSEHVIDGKLRRVLREVALKVGDHVLVPAFQGYKHRLEGTEYLLARDTEILAVVRRGE